eukprot:CAMPEP_0113936614 /NCGR_PEP_ID=MMETSP1339-20121228/3485_1 /TAXON_ID=94617 /ORGANISM="Fibrocapsa japonica" /LENGTH=154 /DNA_ID=CAMNT_0000939145 /DNA_START=40 /DNA_END=504 /DNA_ORIENTATION=- /assembly_acc=CAM_ASM_000762
MKNCAALMLFVALLVAPCMGFSTLGARQFNSASSALARPSVRPTTELKAFFDIAGVALAAKLLTTPIDTSSLDSLDTLKNTPMLMAKTEIREGFYGEYEVELKEEVAENAASTFKSKEKTAEKKNKYTSVLGVLLVGSFVIPMVQYWWYIKEED